MNEPAACLLRPDIFMDLRARVPDRCMGDPWNARAMKVSDAPQAKAEGPRELAQRFGKADWPVGGAMLIPKAPLKNSRKRASPKKVS